MSAAGEGVLVGLAAVAVLGVGAVWLAWRLGVPSILLLLVTGFLAGAGTGFLDPDALLGDLLLPFVSLAVGVILFEGGLTLDFRGVRGHGPVVTRLLLLGTLVTWALTSLAAHFLAGLGWSLALLLGAILVVTGPTVIGPLLRHVRPRGSTGPILRWEGILNDPIGAILALLVFEALTASDVGAATGAFVLGMGRALVAGVGVGLLAAGVVAMVLWRRWVPEYLESPVTLVLVVAAFVGADLVQPEAGLLSVTVMGVALANQRRVHVHRIAEFKENLSVLLIAALFILLAARLEIADVAGLGAGSVGFLAALFLVVRPAAVWASTRGSALTWKERAFLAAMAPRGVVAAAVASVFALRLDELGHPEAGVLVPLMFLVIIATVAVYGLLARPLARGLGLAGPAPQGVLILGASEFPRALAQAVRELGHRAVLVDTNPWKIAAAHREGLEAVEANALTEHFREGLETDEVGRLVAMTPNDAVNALAALQYAGMFGRGEVYQAAAGGGAKGATVTRESPFRGRILFAPDATLRLLEARLAAGDRLHELAGGAAFDAEALAGPSGAQALPVLYAEDAGAFRFVTPSKPVPGRGGVVVYLGGPPPGARGA